MKRLVCFFLLLASTCFGQVFLQNIQTNTTPDATDLSLTVNGAGKARLVSLSKIASTPNAYVTNAISVALETNKLYTTNAILAGLAAQTVTSQQFDNDTYSGFLAQNFGIVNGFNRYAWTNTYEAVRNNQPFVVMCMGDGLVDEPYSNSLFQTVVDRLGDTFGVAGYIVPMPPGYSNNRFGNVSDGYSTGDNSAGAKSADGLGGVYCTNINSFASYRMPYTIAADIFCVGYVQRPEGGNFKIQTNTVNNGTLVDMVTLSGSNSVRTAVFYWWTNSSHLAAIDIKLINTGPGTNFFIYMGAIDSTNKGVILTRESAQASSVASWMLASGAVHTNTYNQMGVKLFLTDYFAVTNGAADVNEFTAAQVRTAYTEFCDILRTNHPNMDVVLCSSFNCPANLSFDVPFMSATARSHGYGYYDGWGIMNDFNTMHSRGLLSDDFAHLTSNGYEFWGKSFWSWLGLTEDHIGLAGSNGAGSNSVAVAASTTIGTVTNGDVVTPFIVDGVSLTNPVVPVSTSQSMRFQGPSGGLGYYFKWYNDHLRITNTVFMDWLDLNGGIILGDGAGSTGTIQLNESTGGIRANGTVTAASFVGDGSGLTNLVLTLPQLTSIPTNSLASAGAVATASVTNWYLLNLTNTINSGGLMYVATNSVNGGYLLSKPTVTVTPF